MTMRSSAGKGTPYWYEWTVGLLKVVDMLYPESGICSVSFQETGVKGWDDVVVRYSDEKIDYYQVKHSREGTNITFGTFVGKDEQGDSLLASLYSAWLKLKPFPGKSRCVVLTNREAGERTYDGRPPLTSFIRWLNAQVSSGKSIAHFEIPVEWESGWRSWLSEMKEGTEAERLNFLTSLDVITNQPDLMEFEAIVQGKLADVFGASFDRAKPLLQALDHALRRWTDSHAHVTAEDVFSSLVLPSDVERAHLAPPPPAPFFPTREKEAQIIEQAIASHHGPSVIFLSANPGAGKTSVLSRIELRRNVRTFGGAVGLRYFAFRPITPESPIVHADADVYVRADQLWFSLLSQLRADLVGQLFKYRVPIRNYLLEWQDARGHVLRIANQLGREMGRRFVIVVDGIDHAARAGRYDEKLARDFFNSLPGPDELKNLMVRLLVAGQPAENYPEYPGWIRAERGDVQNLSLGPLEAADIATIFNEAKSTIPHHEWDRAVATILEQSRGNTLAIVFATEEAKSCHDANELKARLTERSLQHGLQAYYESIWKYALQGLEAGIGVAPCLAGALSLLRERASGALLADCFPALKLSSVEWDFILSKVGPLIVSEQGGFRVLHNDVRVFLSGYLSAQEKQVKRAICSMLADHYLKPTSNRSAAHVSLLPFLEQCQRETETAKIFNAFWVFEAAAFEVDLDVVQRDCERALHAGERLEDWNVILDLACATEILARWIDRSTHDSVESGPKITQDPQIFFPLSEIAVPPLDSWSLHDLNQVNEDIRRLLEAKKRERANALLHRWFDGLTLSTIGEMFFGEVEPDTNALNEQTVTSKNVLSTLGEICRETCYNFQRGLNSDTRHNKAHFYFERGWVLASCRLGPFDSLNHCFLGNVPRYSKSCAAVIEELANNEHWRLVGRLMKLAYDDRANFSSSFQAIAPWYCLRSGIAKKWHGWLDGLKSPNVDFASNPDSSLETPIFICMARGWLEPITHPATIAVQTFNADKAASRLEDTKPYFLLLFRAAAILGRFEALKSKGRVDAAREIFRPVEIKEVLSDLWNESFGTGIGFSLHLHETEEICLRLVQAFFPLSPEHAAALVEIGRPIAERYSGGHRFESLWELFRLAGDQQLRKKLVDGVLGPTGWLWHESTESQRETAKIYLPFAIELGEGDLAESVSQRLRWNRISYSGHKEYSFGRVNAWLTKLIEESPHAFRSIGYRCLSLCEACTALGDNRERWDADESIGFAAISAGPSDAFGLLTAAQSDRGDDSWLEKVRAQFLSGLTWYLSKHKLSPEDKLFCWATAVAMSRWYENDDVVALSDLRTAVLESCTSDGERKILLDKIGGISPGEATRAPVYREPSHEAPKSKASDLRNWKEKLSDGIRLSLGEALVAITDVTQPDGGNQQQINDILTSVGSNSEYSDRWRGHDKLEDIARIVPDHELWSLVKAALREIGRVSYWWYSVSDNLHALVRSRAAVRQNGLLLAGLGKILEMHERLVRGGNLALPMHIVEPGELLRENSWSEYALKTNLLLLSSRYATVVESALSGLASLIAINPQLILKIFEACRHDQWKLQWFLSVAEAWAIKYPAEISECRDGLLHVMNTAKLRLRLQVWIVLKLLARRTGTTETDFVFTETSYPSQKTVQEFGVDEIFFTGRSSTGHFNFSNRYQSAEGTLERVKATTGIDFSAVKSPLSRRLLEQPAFDIKSHPWQHRIRNRDDSLCVGEESNDSIDEEFDHVLNQLRLGNAALIKFAHGYLHSEDGWVLLHTPLPHPCLEHWPAPDRLIGNAGQPIEATKLRNIFRPLAFELGIAEDELVVGAKLRAYTYKEDFEYYCWRQEGDENQPPTTLSGRTFPWLLDDNWWEPAMPHGRRSACFFVGGLRQLMRSDPEVVPSLVWTELFGWKPRRDNPLIWTMGSESAARFEVLHGTCEFVKSRAARQPILHRWIVKKDAWQKALEKLPKLKWHEHFSRVSNPSGG